MRPGTFLILHPYSPLESLVQTLSFVVFVVVFPLCTATGLLATPRRPHSAWSNFPVGVTATCTPELSARPSFPSSPDCKNDKLFVSISSSPQFSEILLYFNLLLLLSSSLETVYVPREFKIAKVVPVFKSGDKHNYTNYRQISLLTSFSKLMEKVVARQLIGFLNFHNLLYKHQYGFRSNYNCSQPVLHLTQWTIQFSYKKWTIMGLGDQEINGVKMILQIGNSLFLYMERIMTL